MAGFTLRQLRYALAVAQERHFGRAAQRCHVTQSALSQQIRTLEDTCGAAIFDRLGKSIRLTPFGREFIDRTTPLLRDADALLAFAQGHSGLPGQPLRFGLIPTTAPYLLPEIFPALTEALPDIKITVSENRTEQLLAALEIGDLDLALIATDPPEGARLSVAPIFADPFVLATQKTDTSAQTPVDLSQIDVDKLLLLDEGHCLRDQAIEACSLRGPDAARAFAATSLSTIVEFVANGQGITLLPTISLHKEAANPRIHIAPLASPGAGRHLNLVWHDATPFADLFKQIAEIIARAGEVRLSKPLPTTSPKP